MSKKFKIFFITMPVICLILELIDTFTRFVFYIPLCPTLPVLLPVLSIIIGFIWGFTTLFMLFYSNKEKR